MLASKSPLTQLTALTVRRYRVPICAIEPWRTAALPVRWQSSRAISGVSFTSGFWPIICSVSFILWSDRIFRNGDWESWMERACFSVSSRTASPVEFAKSKRTIVSVSVSAGAR